MRVASRSPGPIAPLLLFSLRMVLPLGLGCAPMLAAAEAAQSPARELGFEVSDFHDAQGKYWIHVSGKFACDYAQAMDDVIATLWDFADAPRVFSRIEAVRVRSSSAGAAVTEQRTAVRVLGLAFISNLVFRNALKRTGTGAAVLSFELLESDGSCLATRGAWELANEPGPSGPRTHAEFWLDTYVEPRFPGQAAILRGFGAGDMRRTMRELGLAIKRS